MKPYSVKTLFISDVHLGTKHAKANFLHTVLKNVEFENLYLVGDIVDGWELKKSWYWPQEHNNLIQKILSFAKNGKYVVFLPGNHDEFAKQFEDSDFGNIIIKNECIYTTVEHEKHLVTHGDIFDPVFVSRWIYNLGSSAYIMLLNFNTIFNAIRRKFNIPYWSLSSFIKRKTKQALSFIKDFENSCIKYAYHKNCQGVICGHIHEPKNYIYDGINYINCGDWVETCSFVIEDYDGNLELWYYENMVFKKY